MMMQNNLSSTFKGPWFTDIYSYCWTKWRKNNNRLMKPVFTASYSAIGNCANRASLPIFFFYLTVGPAWNESEPQEGMGKCHSPEMGIS